MSLALVLRALALLPIDVAFHVHWILSLPYFPIALKFYRGCWLYGFIARRLHLVSNCTTLSTSG